MKDLAKTISDKARKRIPIVAKLIIELKSHYYYIFYFFILWPRVCQFTDESVSNNSGISAKKLLAFSFTFYIIFPGNYHWQEQRQYE